MKKTSLQAYKPKPQLLLVICLSLFSQFCFAQVNKEHDKTPTEKSVIPLNNEIIVKFNPELINKEAVDDLEKQEGRVIDFIDPKFLELLEKSEFFNEKLVNLEMRKIFTHMTTAETVSISRLGNKVKIPEFWSAFVVTWKDDDLGGLNVLEAIEKLNTLQPFIEYAHWNFELELNGLPNDALFVAGSQGGLTFQASAPDAHINLDPAWDLCTGNNTTKVGVIDSGVNWKHNDMIDGTTVTPAFSRVAGGRDYAFSGKSVFIKDNFDFLGHGSAMAGIIGAIRNNGAGVASIAGGNGSVQDGVQLYNLRIYGYSTKYVGLDKYANALVEGATQTNSKDYGFGLHIINFSSSYEIKDAYSRLAEDATYFAFLNNVVIAASSGNDNSKELKLPSCFNDEWIMRVGASGADGKRTAVSNFGNNLDFIAPGMPSIVNTIDSKTNTAFVTSGGTSSAAAHAAGVSALLFGYIWGIPLKPNDLAPEDIENLLQKFADDDIAIPGYDENTGYGKINAGNALQGIKFPRFQVKHYSKGFIEKDANVVATNKQVTFCSPTQGCGDDLIGDEYEVTFKIDITQAKGRKILDVWALNSMSDVFDGYNKNPFSNKLTLVSWDQNTAVVKGLVYRLKFPVYDPKTNSPIPIYHLRWVFPNENALLFSDKHKVSITVYSEDASITNTLSTSIDETHLRISPNPSNGNFNILFGLLKDTKMGINITDLSGKTVYSEPLRDELEGHKEISLNLNHLNNGMYLCNIITNEGIITKKITIIH